MSYHVAAGSGMLFFLSVAVDLVCSGLDAGAPLIWVLAIGVGWLIAAYRDMRLDRRIVEMNAVLERMGRESERRFR